MTEKPDLTLNDLLAELAVRHGNTIHRVSVWRMLRGLGLTHKIDLQAVEQKRPEVREARQIWITRCQPFMRNLLPCLGFIDETALKTNMAKTTGRAPRGRG
jgi:predicted GNAT family N-acyltransferase